VAVKTRFAYHVPAACGSSVVIRFTSVFFALAAITVAVAAPIPKALRAPRIPNIAGTTWVSEPEADLGQVTYQFHDDGNLTSFHFSIGRKREVEGCWKQDGTTIYFSVNKKYLEYNGTLEDGTIKVHAVNVAKREWNAVLHPQEPQR